MQKRLVSLLIIQTATDLSYLNDVVVLNKWGLMSDNRA